MKARRPHSKRRTGCVNCKSRHARCDEKKPICTRCETAGQSCVYLEVPRRARRCRSPAAFRAFRTPLCVNPKDYGPLQHVSSEPQSDRAAAFFMSNTLPMLTQNSRDKKWPSALMRIVDSEKLLRHYCLAIGALHDHRATFRPEVVSAALSPELAYACKEYSTGLRLLRSALDRGQLPLTTVKTACVLAIIYETMQGRNIETGVHIKAGLQIIGKDATSLPAHTDEDSMNTVLRRFGFLHALYVRPKLALASQIDFKPVPIMTPQDKKSLDLTTLQVRLGVVLHGVFNYTTNCSVKSFPDNLTWACEKTKVLSNLDNWMADYQAVVDSTTDHQTLLELKLLRMQYLSSKLSTRSAVFSGEKKFDNFSREFAEIVQVVTEILADGAARFAKPATRVFSLDLGIITAAWFVSSRCRNPHIRRAGQELLRKVPRFEGLWDAEIAFACSEVAIAWEEKGLGPTDLITEDMITEEQRLTGPINVEDDVESGGPMGKVATFIADAGRRFVKIPI